MAVRQFTRPLFMVLCLGATALGLNNTYGDNGDVKVLAEQTACGSLHCGVKKLSEGRSAFKQSFGFQTALVERGKSPRNASVDVECRRQYWLFGEYQCVIVSGGLAAVP